MDKPEAPANPTASIAARIAEVMFDETRRARILNLLDRLEWLSADQVAELAGAPA